MPLKLKVVLKYTNTNASCYAAFTPNAPLLQKCSVSFSVRLTVVQLWWLSMQPAMAIPANLVKPSSTFRSLQSASRCSCQSCLLAIGHWCKHSSMSHNGSCYVNYATPPTLLPCCRSTQHQIWCECSPKHKRPLINEIRYKPLTGCGFNEGTLFATNKSPITTITKK